MMTTPFEAERPSQNTKEKIIVALDVDSGAVAREIIQELRNDVGAFKIGLQLFTAAGPAFVKELAGSGVRIFLDLKFHDIPNTVARASVEAARMGVWMFNVHSLGGSEMMKRAVIEVAEVCGRENLPLPKIIGVTILTSSDVATLQEVGIETDLTQQVLRLARLAHECGVNGLVASPHEAKAIRDIISDRRFLLVTPGIRPGNATNDDQKRVMTPGAALSAGSDYLVIGRPITEAADRKGMVKAIVHQVGLFN